MQSNENQLLPLPPALVALTRQATWTPVTVGCSGVQMFRLAQAGERNRYLKVAPRDLGVRLADEKARLDWLAGRIPVPDVLYFREDGAGDYLMTSEIAGLMAHDEAFAGNLLRVVRLLATGLRMIHSLPVEDCPFDQRLAARIPLARGRLLAGQVDEADFDAVRQGRRAVDLFDELLSSVPGNEDVVFTHGDYCLPNVILNSSGTTLNGFIDWDRGGIADRYQDLGIAARSLARNGGRQWAPLLFREYGLERVDEAKVRFYQLLDEFF